MGLQVVILLQAEEEAVVLMSQVQTTVFQVLSLLTEEQGFKTAGQEQSFLNFELSLVLQHYSYFTNPTIITTMNEGAYEKFPAYHNYLNCCQACFC